jgi:hypothetical protein
MHATIDGAPWVQRTFPYQVKCLQWINEEYRKLDASARSRIDGMLADTGRDTLILKQ